MLRDDALDLGREHLEAGRVDHVLLAVDDEDGAVLVHAREVAGVQPAVRLDRLPRRLVVPVVALHDDRAPDHQLADLAARHRHCSRRRRRRCGPRHSGSAMPIEPSFVRPVRGERRAEAGELRHAPELDQRAAEPALDLLHLRHRHGLARRPCSA